MSNVHPIQIQLEKGAKDCRLKLLESLEAVAIGVHGKGSLWRALKVVPAASGPDYDTLVRRADEQRERIEAVRLDAARQAFYRDRRDTATPEGMARLLAKIQRGQALGPERTAQLLDIMLRCETGAARLRGLLPPEIQVRHKTGSLGIGVANDVGIIELPDAGHLVVAVFVKESARDVTAQERAIAQIARAAYDYFLFNPK